MTGNQSDIDLLIAWTDSRDRGQIVLLEAKDLLAGANKQIQYKLDRLTAICGEVGAPRFEHTDVHTLIPLDQPEQLAAVLDNFITEAYPDLPRDGRTPQRGERD